MQLRNRTIEPPAYYKQYEQLQKIRSEGIEINQQLTLFIQELQGMMDELNDWDCRSARLSTIIDIYSYVNEHCEKFKGLSRSTVLFAAIKLRAQTMIHEMTGMVHDCDETCRDLLKKLVPVLFDVLLKL